MHIVYLHLLVYSCITGIFSKEVDGETIERSKFTFDDIYLKENNLQNKIYFKNLLNEAIKNYAG